jgi:hypothetical protein
MRTKVKLLSNRFDQPVDYSIFGNMSLDSIWNLLYKFRSKIAHGGKIDFRSEFKVLGSSYEVQLFLEIFTKTLLRGSIQEPELYSDLKKC